MTETTSQKSLESLDVFVGEWSIATSLAPNPGDAPRARTTFEWLTGRRFLVQRWEVEHPEAPDGIAIIGFDTDKATYLQHFRFTWRRTGVRDEPRRQPLDAPARRTPTRLLAALHRHLQRRRRHD